MGFGVGFAGGYFGFEALIPYEAFRQTYKNCVNNNCGVQCEPDKPCFIDDMFQMVLNE